MIELSGEVLAGLIRRDRLSRWEPLAALSKTHNIKTWYQRGYVTESDTGRRCAGCRGPAT